jgi:glycosyltransferase involved in cell wall biosynthesis
MNTQNKIRVSVVIPCYNDGQFIREAIASVEACSDPVWEIIIVNDGSTDAVTLSILDDLKNRGYHVINRENGGPPAARNTGITAAKGDYILPLDSDCRIRPAYIQRGIEILDRHPDVAVVYGDLELFGEKKGIQKAPGFDLKWLVNHNYIDNCAVFRKSVWQECGPYDVNMPYKCYDDWDFWLSVAKKGHGFYHVPEVLFDYRVRPVSLSTVSRSKEKSMVVVNYIATKHAALFPKEFRYYYKPYRKLLGIWQNFQLLLRIH